MLAKDKQLRFGIADNNGHRAATWTVTSPRSKSDIYLSCRELKGTIKVSLHESGSWHIGYAKDVEKLFELEQSRYIEIWNRPNTIAPGFTLALRIVTPYSAVTSLMNKSTKDIVWIQNCVDGFATEIDLIITSGHEFTNSWPGKTKMNTELLGHFKLANGETVWLVHWTIPMPNLSKLKLGQLQFMKGKSKHDMKNKKLRAIIFGDEKDGSRTIFDCALQPSK